MRLIDADAHKAALSAQDYDAWSDRADLFVALAVIDETPTVKEDHGVQHVGE